MSESDQVQTNLRIDAELLEWLKRLAIERDRSLSYVANNALTQYRREIVRNRDRRRARTAGEKRR